MATPEPKPDAKLDALPPSVQGEEADELLAGWFDGHRAGRAQTFNEVADCLAPHGYSIEHDELLRCGGEPSPRCVVPAPDNDGNDSRYAEGYEQGFAAARARLVMHVREQLAQDGHFLSDGLRVLTHAEASDFVDGLCPVQDLPHRNDLAAAIPEGGMWNMVVRSFTRRAAIITVGTTIVAASLGWIGAMQLARPAPAPPPPTWTPPLCWDGDSSLPRQMLLAIDETAFNLEQAEGVPSPTLLTHMQQIFALQDSVGELGRSLYCRWIGERDRSEYVAALLTQLNPTLQGAPARGGILKAVGLLHHNNLPSIITTAHRQTLQAYQASQLENDEHNWDILERLVEALVAAGI